MKKSKIFIIPVILAILAVGLSFPLLTPFLKPISVVVDPSLSPINSNPYPDGTEINPTPLKIGQAIQVRLDATDQSGSGIDCVVCTIFDVTESSKTVAVLYLKNIGGNTWAKEWTVPSEYTYRGATYQIKIGSKLKFYFASESEVQKEIKEPWGYRYEYTTYLRPGPTTYGYISGVLVQPPEGYFKINGKEATSESIHIIFDPTVTFTFTATKHPESISAVKISVNDEVFALDKVSGTEYRKIYTLPGPGKYEIEGWIVPTYDSSKQIIRMSIVTEHGTINIARYALAWTVLLASMAAIIVIVLRRLR